MARAPELDQLLKDARKLNQVGVETGAIKDDRLIKALGAAERKDDEDELSYDSPEAQALHSEVVRTLKLVQPYTLQQIRKFRSGKLAMYRNTFSRFVLVVVIIFFVGVTGMLTNLYNKTSLLLQDIERFQQEASLRRMTDLAIGVYDIYANGDVVSERDQEFLNTTFSSLVSLSERSMVLTNRASLNSTERERIRQAWEKVWYAPYRLFDGRAGPADGEPQQDGSGGLADAGASEEEKRQYDLAMQAGLTSAAQSYGGGAVAAVPGQGSSAPPPAAAGGS